MNVIHMPSRGVIPEGADHPRWADGAPILCGDDVDHADHGWTGMVIQVGFDEVVVSWDLGHGEGTDGEEYSPDDLRRIE